MKETYKHEFNAFQRLLNKTIGMWRINSDSIDFNWGYFAPRFGLEFLINQGTYFDQRYSVGFCLVWGKFCIKLPFKTKREESCEWPRYGIQIHGDTFWIHLGRHKNKYGFEQDKWITWDLPFFSWTNHRLWIKDSSGLWVKEQKGQTYKWRDEIALKESHPFVYTLRSGEVQNRTATIYEEKRSWSRKWFPFLKKHSHSISIDFDDEVGERSGSWKGGTVGCSYDMLPNETPLECLRRMEIEREFN